MPLAVSQWCHVAIGIATRHLMRASRRWEKYSKEDVIDGVDNDFATGDDEEELEIDTFRLDSVCTAHVGQKISSYGAHDFPWQPASWRALLSCLRVLEQLSIGSVVMMKK